MAELALPTYSPFDCKSEGKSIRWRKWVDRLKNVFIGYNIQDNARKAALLLTFAGNDLNDLVDSFPAENLAPADGENAFDKLVEAVTNHFNPETNVEFQRYTFRHMIQTESTTDEFYGKLNEVAKTCAFTDIDSELKSQLISGCKSHKVRQKGLTEAKVSVRDLLSYARTLETAELHARQIEGASTGSVNRVDAGNKPQYKRKPQRHHQPKQSTKPGDNNSSKKKPEGKCNNCGGAWPHNGGQRKCPAFGKTCVKCNKYNHFASVCQSSQVHMLHGTEDSEETDFVFTISKNKSGMPTFTVRINNHPVEILADSGASVNILSEDDYAGLNPKPQLVRNTSRVYPYGASSPLNTLGSFVAQINHRSNSYTTRILVVQGGSGSLLGWNACTNLQLLSTSQPDLVHAISKPSLLDNFPELFRGIGKLKGVKVKLHIDPSVHPIAQKCRRVPFHIRKDIEQQLKVDEESGIITKPTGPTPWVSPIVCVPKPKTGKTRVCVDMRMANRAIRREHHTTPTLSELISDLSGSKVFSTLDLNQGYNQLELDETSRSITTFTTHVGLRQYTRLFFGISSAAEVFQDAVCQVLSGLKGVVNISDDILVFGKSEEQHDENLKAALQRLSDSGLTLNRAKCKLYKSSVEYFGHVFSAAGMSASPEKLKAIVTMPTPTNQAELRSFLGLTNYCGSRFVEDYATLTYELRLLTQKNTPWKWLPKHDDAITKLKDAISKGTTLRYYSIGKPTELLVDASPIGLCGILTQLNPDGSKNIISFASRSLTSVESRYSQTEREALAIIWACEYFHLYLFGSAFTVVTDHKPLIWMFGNPKSTLPSRIERWAMRLQPYELTVVYRAGKDNPADYLSRHPMHKDRSSREEKVAEEYVQYIAENTTPKAMTLDEVAAATCEDQTLRVVLSAAQSNRWYDMRVNAKLPLNNTYVVLQKSRHEISLAHNNSVILKGNRIVLPEKLQQRAIDLAHSGHQGIVKTVALLREKVWFARMQTQVEETIKNCMDCQVATSSSTREPLKMSPLPTAPWIELSADFCNIAEGQYAVVVQDEYSRYVVVDTLTSLTAKAVIPKFDKIFSEFGIPEQLKTDNGPPFQSEDFAKYLEFMGIRHRKITPLWPRANAETERFMRTLKKSTRGKTNWKQEMHKLLLAYRATPHSTTGIAPATVLFGRDIRTRLPTLTIKAPSDVDLRTKDAHGKEKMKHYADSKSNIKPSNLEVGDHVLVKDTRKIKGKTPFEPEPATITARNGSMISARRGSQVLTRNSSFFKRSPESPASQNPIEFEPDAPVEPNELEELAIPDMPEPVVEPGSQSTDQAQYSTPRRSTRERNQPVRFQDYKMN